MTKSKLFLIATLFFFTGGIIAGYGWYIRGDNVSVETVRALLSGCTHYENGTDYVRCVRQSFQKVIHPRNLSVVMQILQVHTTPEIFPPRLQGTLGCHEVGHVIGEIAASLKAPIPYLINACSSRCGYGCAHGLMVGLLRQNPHALDHPDRLCSSTSNYTMTRSDAIACHHGIGHANAEYASYRIQNALVLCNRFEKQYAREECYTGVFMEIFDAPTFTHALPTVPTDAQAFCKNMPEGTHDTCIAQVAFKQSVSTHDIRVGYQTCQTLAVDKARTCAVGIGSDVYFSQNGDSTSVATVCAQGIQFIRQCLEGAITSSLIIDATGIQATKICNATMPSFRSTCLAYLQTEKERMQKGAP